MDRRGAGCWFAMTALWIVGTVAVAAILWAVFNATMGPVGFGSALLCVAVYAVIQAGVVVQRRIQWGVPTK